MIFARDVLVYVGKVLLYGSVQVWSAAVVYTWILCGAFFFFSSRRRHTRFDCDWSSDVCSSDLVAHHARTITMSDPAQLKALIEAEKPDLVVPEIEAIATPMLEELEAAGVVTVIPTARAARLTMRSEEHTSELQSQSNLVCRLLLEKKKKKQKSKPKMRNTT